MDKPELFPDKKTFAWFSFLLLVLIMLRLFIEYQNYQNFIAKPFYYTYANVVSAYEKSRSGKRYKVLKLQSDEGFTFYTTTHFKDDVQYKRVRVQISPNKHITFQGYLGTFYVKSKIKEKILLPLTVKDTLLKQVSSQHEDSALGSFYNAIFFATPLDKDLREKISMLGVSHLVALSGFHLGILWGLVYGVLLLLYKPFQQHFFPYRHALRDVGLVAMILLGTYVWFVDFPPSLLRSYTMLLVGWIMLLLGVELLSFTFLASVFLLLGLLFPSLLVSLSFWLSVAGVFYIFLLLQYTKHWSKWVITVLVIPLGIFVLMLPIVHGIFSITSSYQLLSPLLSLLFIPFYPLSMLLHLLGWGGSLDGVLLSLFSLPKEGVEHVLSLEIVAIYIVLSLLSIRYKKVFYILLILACLYAFYLFVLIK